VGGAAGSDIEAMEETAGAKGVDAVKEAMQAAEKFRLAAGSWRRWWRRRGS
jgi:hypothetical protein